MSDEHHDHEDEAERKLEEVKEALEGAEAMRGLARLMRERGVTTIGQLERLMRDDEEDA